MTDAGEGVWPDAMVALALFARDPSGLGGISLRAAAGPVRDRFLSLLRQALPSAAPVRKVPVHTGDERLLGGLDLAATLRSGRPIAQPGMLAEADGGILVLAMAERMTPAVSARVGAAMDLGCVGLEPARFGVIALDEGIADDEHPPAGLLDRLAFHIDLTGVAPRDALNAPGPRLSPDGAAATPAPSAVAADAMEALCATAMALGVASIRAPLLAVRVARTAAALDGRDTAGEADVLLAGRLVLAPRATRLPPAGDPEPEPDGTDPDPSDREAKDTDQAAGGESDSEPETAGDRPLEDRLLDAVRAALPPDLLAALALAGGPARARQSGRSGQIKISTRRGRPIGVRQGLPRDGARLHLLETLKAAAPWQTLRHRAGGTRRIEVRPDDFRIVRFQEQTETTTVFAVDASGSAALNRLGEAKGAVELLLADCYVRRDQVALIAFRGREATLLLPPTGSLVRAKRCLAGLPGGGATPLAAAIDAAAGLAEAERRRGRTPVIVFLTDGRANMTRDGAGGRPPAEAEALASAGLVRAAGFTVLLVDTSPRPNPFARRLAEAMNARYVPLPQADASALSRTVRAVAVS